MEFVGGFEEFVEGFIVIVIVVHCHLSLLEGSKRRHNFGFTVKTTYRSSASNVADTFFVQNWTGFVYFRLFSRAKKRKVRTCTGS